MFVLMICEVNSLFFSMESGGFEWSDVRAVPGETKRSGGFTSIRRSSFTFTFAPEEMVLLIKNTKICKNLHLGLEIQELLFKLGETFTPEPLREMLITRITHEQKQLISVFCVMQLSHLQAGVLNPGRLQSSSASVPPSASVVSLVGAVL